MLPNGLEGTGFELIRLIGQGGMGHVYEGKQTNLQRPVAIKLLDRRQAEEGDPACAERLHQEARVLAQFTHENIVQVLHLGNSSTSGDPFVVMELLRGETLHELIERERVLTAEQAVKIMSQVFAGLGVVHKAGYVHRDLKPRNIFITTEGIVKLLDFGAVKLISDDDDDPFSTRHIPAALTRQGQVLGTVRFMAPEQVSGHPCDPRTDIYAAGIVLYRMLAGQDPFMETTQPLQAMAHLRVVPPPLTQFVQVPPGINQAVMRALEKKPDRRFSSVQAFNDALTAAISGVHAVPDVSEGGTVRMDIKALRPRHVLPPPSPPPSSPGRLGLVPVPSSSSSSGQYPIPAPPPSSSRFAGVSPPLPPSGRSPHPIPFPPPSYPSGPFRGSSSDFPTATSPTPPAVPPISALAYEPSRRTFLTFKVRPGFWMLLAVCFFLGVMGVVIGLLRNIL